MAARREHGLHTTLIGQLGNCNWRIRWFQDSTCVLVWHWARTSSLPGSFEWPVMLRDTAEVGIRQWCQLLSLCESLPLAFISASVVAY